MKYRDTPVSDSSIIPGGNRFWIPLDVSLLIEQLNKKDLKNQESLSKIEGNLFSFYQHLKWKRDILTKDPAENAIVIPGHENSSYLTFKLNYTKNIKLNEHVKLALFIWMMPQFLNGSEFAYAEPEVEELVKSPRGQIWSIVTKWDSRYYTYVDVEGCWTWFSDNNVHQLNFYENVIESILKDVQIPMILIYKVCPWPIQRPNAQVKQMLNEYLGVVISKKFKKNIKAVSTFGDKDKEEEKNELDRDTSSENDELKRQSDSPQGYKERGTKRSLIEDKKNKKRSTQGTTRTWCFF